MGVLEPTQDPSWVLTHEGYNVLTENAVESRFALGNGFLGMRASRPVSRGPTWVSWQGQRFACARLSRPCLPKSCPGVSATLTTTAFARSGLRWLEIGS